MKTLLLTLTLCLFNLTTTEIIGKYQIESKLAGDTLELKKDGTYEYQSRGDSCWTWYDFEGQWVLKNDLLILQRNYSYEEDATEFIEKTDEVSKKFVTITVIDNFEKPIPNFQLNYSPTYDETITKTTDINGIVIFNKKNTSYDEDDTVGIRMEFKTNGNDTSLSGSVYGISDRITISINSEPKTIDKHDEYKFSVKKGKLKSIVFPYVDGISTYKKL